MSNAAVAAKPARVYLKPIDAPRLAAFANVRPSHACG